MGSDAAMANVSVGDGGGGGAYGKKKRTNRSARLKQCKLDARREQWLSQVKNKDCPVENEHSTPAPFMSPSPPALARFGKTDSALGGRGSRGPPEARPRREGNNSSTQEFPSRSLSRSSSSSASDANEGDEDVGMEGGGLDDWEAVADALSTDDGGSSPLNSEHNVTAPVLSGSAVCRNGDGILRRPEPDRTITRAWRPDDVFRPQCLPNLSKQRGFPLGHGQGTVRCARHGISSQSSSCPICYEDLDLTDSSFLPCSCGFRLCLFCHKRILEADGRCPGCRKQYGPVGGGEMGLGGGGVPLLSMRLSRSCRLSLRS